MMILNKIINFIKTNYKYFIYFFFIFIVLILFGSNNTDNIWNYGMAHAIRIGEVPYRDFNIITTPLYPIIMSIPLFIYDSYITYIIIQSLLCTSLIYLINKLISNKTIILFFIMCFPIFNFLFPNYNFLIFLLLVLLIYLEKNNTNDYIIGIILGLLILTKHTIGGVVFILSLLSTRSINKSYKRFISTSIIGIIFILYLLITKSFNSFINLSILGLFDFGNNNKYYSIICIIILLLVIIYIIYSFIKYKKDYLNYYLLSSISLIIPILDFTHISYLLVFTSLIILMRLNIKDKFIIKYIFFVFICCLFSINIFINIGLFLNVSIKNINHFNLYIINNDIYKYYNEIKTSYLEHDNSYMFGYLSMFMDISCDRKINYYDIPLYGNFGYNGIDNMNKEIDNMHDVYFYISKSSNRQFALEIYNHIIDKGTYIDSVYDYDIYYLK